ncbi:MAG TPA: adenosyl-hopene transferase HpnH [Chthoniobacteraceae bacterium]|jgi:MoaA/NifB/PqqE/SkfB family radical SAM enzyme|nr:moaA1 [Chthoniobacter sp.]HEV7869046.1 adenosyl-hopene transferase HpnH [Chthoniobacteraceae bacterium]
MRFPLPLTAKIAAYIIGKKLRKIEKFATVLQLEPLHTCNLTCTGCGRIREYSTSIKDVMPLADCLGAAEECGAPMISICGGEPLIYPKIEELVDGLLGQGRIVYLCTNATAMRKKMRDYLKSEYGSLLPADCTLPISDCRLQGEKRTRHEDLERKVETLLREDLITAKQGEEIRAARPPKPAKGATSTMPLAIAPNQFMYWNVHLDGLERTHDLIVEREGVFKEAVLAIRMAKVLGYQVATNTTVYRETDPQEIEQMFAFLGSLGVDGHTISPGYDYDAAKVDMMQRLDRQPEDFFLTREMTREKFANAVEWGERYPIFGTPTYLEFLAGRRDLTCSAWAIPTRNVRGWKGPCYLMTDGHYATYNELLGKTDWNKLGVVNGEARDPRCENCMVHCGYEPTASLGLQAEKGDMWKNIKFNFGRKPVARGGEQVHAFNGVSAGQGHLTGRKEEAVALQP